MKIITHTATKSTRGRGLALRWGIHDFPCGKILVALSDEGLCWLGINCGAQALAGNWPGAQLTRDQSGTAKAAQEIAALWPQKMEGLSIPVVLYGTPFQLRVWRQLLKIKPGQTATYGDIAQKIGCPESARAVGGATGRNTVAIIVPCHRVVNKSAAIINYEWGPAVKKRLLAGESVVA